MNLKQRGAEMVAICDRMVLGFSVDWKVMAKEDLENNIKILTSMVRQFKSELDDFGYCY
jgi:hypothetical protein